MNTNEHECGAPTRVGTPGTVYLCSYVFIGGSIPDDTPAYRDW
jgi:hypothetical protein